MTKRLSFGLLPGLLLFGTIWGFSEATFGEYLYANNIPHASIYLTFIAVVILAAARISSSFALTGTIIGLIAMLFKLVNVPFYGCHLLAIALLGTGFDAAYALMKRFQGTPYRAPLVGITANYIGRALFAVSIMYVVRYEHWTVAGLPKVIDYIFISGTVSAAGAMIAVPIGERLAVVLHAMSMPKLFPRLSSGVALVATACVWALQLAM
jgi:hypothetical protein